MHKVVIVYYIHKNGKVLLVTLFPVYIVGLHGDIDGVLSGFHSWDGSSVNSAAAVVLS